MIETKGPVKELDGKVIEAKCKEQFCMTAATVSVLGFCIFVCVFCSQSGRSENSQNVLIWAPMQDKRTLKEGLLIRDRCRNFDEKICSVFTHFFSVVSKGLGQSAPGYPKNAFRMEYGTPGVGDEKRSGSRTMGNLISIVTERRAVPNSHRRTNCLLSDPGGLQHAVWGRGAREGPCPFAHKPLF